MSDEIALTFKAQVTKNAVSIVNSISTLTQDMQTDLSKLHHTVQEVGTSAEDLSTGDVDITEQHGILLVNRAAGNFVSVICRKDATPTDTTVAILLPGEPFGPIRAPAQTAGYPKYRLQSDTGDSDVEVMVWDAGDPAA